MHLHLKRSAICEMGPLARTSGFGASINGEGFLIFKSDAIDSAPDCINKKERTAETGSAALRESRGLPHVAGVMGRLTGWGGAGAGGGRGERLRHGDERVVRTARQLHFRRHPEILGRLPPVIGLVAYLVLLPVVPV